MRVGIFGPRGAGKSTVFACLTGLRGARDGPVLGTVKVPDARVDFLASVYRPRKVTYAEVVFSDLPGSDGAALDARMAAPMREMDVLTLVTAAFPSPTATRPPDPLRDYLEAEAELLLWDLATVERRLERLAKQQVRTQERALLERCREALEAEVPLRLAQWTEQEARLLKGYGFLSRKRLIVLVNTSEEEPRPALGALEAECARRGSSLLAMSARLEKEILELAPGDRAAFLAELGETATARDRYIRHAYRELDLISFLTAGEDECRAWSITRGTKAPQAAGVIHSDMERGFIRAEVISFEDFERHGSEAAARAAGRYRLEGKDYVVQDGDIVSFRFNV